MRSSLTSTGSCIGQIGCLPKQRFSGIIKMNSDVHPNPIWQDPLFAQFLFAEARWLVRHTLPFGLTVIAVGRKQ